MPKKYRQFVLLSLILYTSSIVFISCQKKEIIVEDSSIKQRSIIREKSKNIKPSETIRVEDLYIVPEYFNYILTSPPDIIELSVDKGNVLKEVQENLDISAEEELQKYLERQKNYNKTSIFSDIP